jgi:predicted nucleic acid-binding protein
VKLLLDTNVLVAAHVARVTCSDLLEHCVRQHVVISSQPLLNELREVLDRKFRSELLMCGESSGCLQRRSHS